MNCFEIIKTVLDEVYDSIPGDSKDTDIVSSLRELSEDYSCLRERGCFDYTRPSKRFAYIYKYTTSHANIVYRLIAQCREISSLFSNDKVSISCIGGGPGSDFLGILKFCRAFGYHPDLRASILDRDPAWSESWSDVDDKIGSDFRLSTVFHTLDVCETDSWKLYKKHYNSDLFTLVYFMSEVHFYRENAQPYFESLFDNMKSGAVVLFVDNNWTDCWGWFDELAEEFGIDIVSDGRGKAQMPSDEEKNALGEYLDKFGPPKLTTSIAYRVGVKE